MPVRVEQITLESPAPRPFDVVVFQESSQDIESRALFAKAAQLARDVMVIDDFAAAPVGTLHRLDDFLDGAKENGLRNVEDVVLRRWRAIASARTHTFGT